MRIAMEYASAIRQLKMDAKEQKKTKKKERASNQTN